MRHLERYTTHKTLGPTLKVKVIEVEGQVVSLHF